MCEYFNIWLIWQSFNKNKKKIKWVFICKQSIKKLSEINDKEKREFISELISENLLSVFNKIGCYTLQENDKLIKNLTKLKKYINYGSTLSKKITVICLKVFGIKLTFKILSKIRKIKK